MGLALATLHPSILPLGIAGLTMPCGPLQGHRYAQECTHVGDWTVQPLEVHIERLAVGATRLLVEPDALYVEAFENWLVEKAARVGFVGGPHVELDATNEVGNEPVQPDQIFIRQKTFDARRL